MQESGAGRIANLIKRWTHKPKGTGFDLRLDHKRRSTDIFIISHGEISLCEIIKMSVDHFKRRGFDKPVSVSRPNFSMTMKKLARDYRLSRSNSR
jgi:hypothetical protein